MRFFKLNVFIFLLLLAQSVFAVGITQVPVYDTPTQTIVATKAMPRFVISQPANPTTGYSWKTEYYDNSMLDLLVSNYQPPLNQLMGASGRMLWVFQVKQSAFDKPRSSIIKLVYEKKWDPKDNPVIVEFMVRSNP